MKLHIFMMICLGFVLSFFLCGCEAIQEFLEESEEAEYSENPNSESFKPRYIITVCTIVKYPRAGDLEQELQGVDGSRIWVNTNQNFSSKNIRDAQIVPRPGDPNVCDLKFKLDRLGKLQWQILAGNHIDKPVAFIVDGLYYTSFIPEPPVSDQSNWVTLRVGINPYTAKGIAKFAKKNYTYYNPSTSSWFK